jgi:uncharacterized protein
MIKPYVLGLMLLAAPLHVQAQDRLPIIDMHLHALTADYVGSPPMAMCTPIDPFPAWDPAQPYGATYMSIFKEPSCVDPVWSPMTDQELMENTLAALERLNIIGVVSGPAERVAAWRVAAPERLIPALMLAIDENAPSPDELRRLYERGELAVLGEVVTQYQGISPTTSDSPRTGRWPRNSTSPSASTWARARRG